MINYRYVSQGEFYITTDPDTVLVTSGMTECIAMTLVDKSDPSNRLLAHLDGQILTNKVNAVKNLKIIAEAFQQQTKASAFEVYLLGGQKKFHNYRILMPALNELEIQVTKCVDINEFCSLLNVNKTGLDKFQPLNVAATLVCGACLPPDFISYSNYYFNPPLSESELACGKGMTSAEEQEEYERFTQINEEILSRDPTRSQQIRTSADKKWMASHYFAYQESHHSSRIM